MNNEKGSVLVFALFVMFAVTLMAIIASKSTSIESKIIRSQKIVDEELAYAEAALNLAVRNFRLLPSDMGYSITNLLNDRAYPSPDPDNNGNYHDQAVYINNSEILFPESGFPVALIEIRRIIDEDKNAPGLSTIANDVPIMDHRYYAGSIDRKRFAITVTAYIKDTTTPSSTWIKKGVDLPSKQNSDLF